MPERDEPYDEESLEERPPANRAEASGSSEEERARSADEGSEGSSGKEESSASEAASSDEEQLYFFPDDGVGEEELRSILASDDVERRAWAISHLLRYAQWDDIWDYVERDTVREIFPHLDLPENLRSAWARMLKIEVPVS